MLKLVSIYLGSGVLAILLVIVLLDRLSGHLSRKKDEVSGLKLLLATLNHLKDRRMQLVLPITFFSGIEQAFIFGDFTKVRQRLLIQWSIKQKRVGFGHVFVTGGLGRQCFWPG